MRRAFGVAVIVGVASVVLGGGRAAAADPTPDAVAAAIAERGWYADPEAVGDREQLGQVAARLAQQGDAMGFALLAAEPAGSSPAFAEQVLDALPSQTASTPIRTIVVLSDADVGVVSDQWSDAAIDGALDETIDQLRANPTDGLEALADALADQPAGFSDDETSDDGAEGGGLNGGLVALLVIAVIVAIGAPSVRRFLSGGDVFAGDLFEDDSDTDDDSSSWTRRRRTSSFFSSSRRSRSSSRSSHRSSSSSGSSHRGRGGRRL